MAWKNAHKTCWNVESDQNGDAYTWGVRGQYLKRLHISTIMEIWNYNTLSEYYRRSHRSRAWLSTVSWCKPVQLDFPLAALPNLPLSHLPHCPSI